MGTKNSYSFSKKKKKSYSNYGARDANYQIYIYIYACLEEVDFIVCDCFLSNPFFSYELGIFT